MIESPYESYRASLEDQIAHSKDDVKAKLANPETFPAPGQAWKAAMDSSLRPILQVPNASSDLVRPPKNVSIGWDPDYALPLFGFARNLKKNPVLLATDVVDSLRQNGDFDRVEAIGAYVNMSLMDRILLGEVQGIIADADQFGRSGAHAGEVAIVEYSSPNVAKPFGINHLRSTVIGESIARLLDASGYVVVRDNHLGDWGTQFGNLLAAHEEYAPEQDFSSLSVDELTALYVRFSEDKKTSPRLVRAGQTAFSRLEQGDEDLREKWSIALDKSIEEFNRMYDRLNVHFDTMIGEAYYVDAANKLVDGLSDRVPADVVVTDEESKAVYINGEHPVVVRTQDGYGVYAARDLATIQFRAEAYQPGAALYVVGNEQSSYFRSVFDVAAQAGLTKGSDGEDYSLEHVNFGLLLDENGKKLSTRKGTSGKLEDVLQQLDDKAASETLSRNPDMPDTQVKDIAHAVAVGALIWNDLRTERTSSVRFDVDNMLKLGGGSVVDIMYSYSRTCSILDKVKDLASASEEPATTSLPDTFSTKIEHRLAVQLNEFEAVIKKSADDRAPHNLVQYIQELSQLHGRFYEESRVIGVENKEVVAMRVALHRAYKVVVENGLGLLNIQLTQRI